MAPLSLVTNISCPRFQGSVPWHGPFVPCAWQWLPLPGRLLSAHPYWPPLLHAGLVLHLLSAQIRRDENDATSSLRLCSLASNIILTLCIFAVGGGRCGCVITANGTWVHCDAMQRTVRRNATASCVRATLPDLSHYGWMLEIWDYCISSSTNVNWCLGVHLYLFSKCVYAFHLECVSDAQ